MTEPSTSQGPVAPLLRRLNRRGFRLVMLLDGLAVFGLSVAVMFYRFGRPASWPTYTTGAYAVSFTVATLIFVATFYFGGLYEREPRLGGAAVLPKAARLSLAAGSFIALLNLALTGLLQQRGSLSQRALPFPIWNLVIVIVLAGVAVAINRAIVHSLRTRREGLPRVVLAGDEADLELARRHLAANVSELVVVAEVDDPRAVVEVARESHASDVLLVTAAWLDEWYPRTIGRLDRLNVTTLLRVTGRETLFGLDRLREVGGLPFVLLLPDDADLAASLQAAARRVPPAGHRTGVGAAARGCRALPAGRGGASAALPPGPRRGGRRDLRDGRVPTMRVDAESDGVAQLSQEGDPRVSPRPLDRATRADSCRRSCTSSRGRCRSSARDRSAELTKGFEKEIAGYTRRHEAAGPDRPRQIHGRYHTDAEYKLGYDLQYLVNWSPCSTSRSSPAPSGGSWRGASEGHGPARCRLADTV